MENYYYPFNPMAFRMAPSGACPYPHPAFRRTLEALEEAFRRGDACAVLSGPPGTGKSALAEQLVERFRAAGGVASPVISGQLAGDDLLRLVAFALGIDQEADKASLYFKLERKLERYHARGQRLLIWIDEAQDLDETALEELRLLCCLQRESAPLLQVLLVGQPELLVRLGSARLEGFRQRITTMQRLASLSRTDTRGYVGHRLAVVGWRGEPVISGEVLDLLHEFSGGVPAWINLAVSRLLWRGDAERAAAIDAAFAQQVLSEMERDGLLPEKHDPDPLGLFDDPAENEPSMSLDGTAAQEIAASLAPARDRLMQAHHSRRGIRISPAMGPWLERIRGAHGPWRTALGSVAVVALAVALLRPYFGTAAFSTDDSASPTVQTPTASATPPAPMTPALAAAFEPAREMRSPARQALASTRASLSGPVLPTSGASFLGGAAIPTRAEGLPPLGKPLAERLSDPARPSSDTSMTPLPKASAEEMVAELPRALDKEGDPASGYRAAEPAQTESIREPLLESSDSAPQGALTEVQAPASVQPEDPLAVGSVMAAGDSTTIPDVAAAASDSRPVAANLAASSPDTDPADMSGPVVDRAGEKDALAGLLAAAATALRDDRLTFPEGNSAFDHFNAVLRLDSANREALAGLQAISDRYDELAAQAMEEGKLDLADRFITRGLRIDPEDEALRQRRQSLDELVYAREQQLAQTIEPEPEPEPVEVLTVDPSPLPMQLQPVRHHKFDY